MKNATRSDGFDCVVIGSGAGGLSAAIAAAAEGRSVQVLEASSAFGGYLNPFRRHGYEFDTGLHILGELEKGGTLHTTLQALGVREGLRFIPLDPECSVRVLFADPGFEFRVPAGLEPLRERLLDAFPREAAGVHRHVARLEDCRDVARAFQPPFHWWRGLRVLPRLPRILKTMKMTFGQYLDGVTRDPLLRAVLAFNWGTYGLPPGRASAFYALMVGANLSSLYYPAGGSRAFRDALVDRALRLGVEMRKRSEVVHVGRDGRAFAVRVADGRETRARTVVCNADPHHLYGRILDRSLVPSGLLDKVRATRYSMSVFCAYIGTSSDPTAHGLGHAMAEVFAGPDLDGMWDRTLASEEGVMFGNVSVFAPSARDPDGGHAPPGRHVIEVLAPAVYGPYARWAGTRPMKRGPEYEAFKARVGQRLLAEVERFFPGLTSGAEHVEFSTPLTNESWVRAPFGACYGPDQGPDQVGPGRFQIASPVPGLFLCGAGTKGGGVSPCLHSGLAAGRKAAAYAKKHA